MKLGDLGLDSVRSSGEGSFSSLVGHGFVAGEHTAYEARWLGPGVCLLWLDGHGDFEIRRSPRGTVLRCLGSVDLPTEVLLGPPLLLALALGKTHTLHASAVATEHQSIAFCGESGAGKSTLAALFAERGWRRLADDQLAVRSRGAVGLGIPQAMPQLKLRHQDRGVTPAPPLTKLFVLEPSRRAHCRFADLQGGQAIREVLAAITPFALYSPGLAAEALATVGRAVSAGALAVQRIDYPHRPSALEEVYEAISEASPRALSA